ncbi:hypothetical protein CPB85DRAFT_676166 [Mucidula mucida]|nr:hypothetical protein CPB85DRAFT_676166 [Mucidula mucida]
MNGHDAAATCEPGPSHLRTNGASPTNKTSGSAKSTPNDDPPPVTLARPFRSRKNRPCDGCRRAKTRCAIVVVGTPCVECQHTRKKCTFDELPRQRKKPAASTDRIHHRQMIIPKNGLFLRTAPRLPASNRTAMLITKKSP